MGRSRIRTGVLRDDAPKQVDTEIRHHLEELVDRLVEQGWSVEAARLEAERRFGNAPAIRREMIRMTRSKERRARMRNAASSIAADLRHAVRGLQRSPGFALTVIATLGLGLGAAVAVFTVIDALLLRPLPYRAVDRMVTLDRVVEGGYTVGSLDVPFLEQWRDSGAPLDEIGVYDNGDLVRTGDVEPEAVSAYFVSTNLDDVIGMRAALGRTFADDDATPGVNRAMLSWQYWRKLGGDPSIVGSTMVLEGRMYEIVGVMPGGLKFPVSGLGTDVWIAMGSDYTAAGQTFSRVRAVTHIAVGVSYEAAQARVDAIAEAFDRVTPDPNGWKLKLGPIGSWRANPDLEHGVWLMGAAVLLMLLIALANGINLLLFRAAERAREISVRIALGGGRVRLLRLLTTEGLVLGIASGVLAIAMAALGVRGLVQLMPSDLAFSSAYAFTVERRVLLFAFAVSAITGTILGAVPAVFVVRSARRFDLLGGRGTTRHVARMHDLLVVAEVTLAMALLVSAGMLSNSLLRLGRVDVGFDADHVAILSLNLPVSRYATAESRAILADEVVHALDRVPGVRGTWAGGVPPHAGFSFGVELQAEGREALAYDRFLLLPIVAGGPDYMDVLGGTLVAGRSLEESDYGTPNVLIDEPLATALFGGPAVGSRFRTSSDGDYYTVVGVFRHMSMAGLDDRSSPFAIVRPRNPARAATYVSFAIRAPDPASALPQIRDAVHSIDADLPMAVLATARAELSGTIDKPRFLASVMIALSITATVLAALGVYGVLAYAVTQRRREMGVRIAIGAPPGHVTGIFLTRGLLVCAIGAVAGIAIGRLITSLTRTLLFGIEPGDPITIGITVALMALVTVAASVLPARAATRVDPMEVLRVE